MANILAETFRDRGLHEFCGKNLLFVILSEAKKLSSICGSEKKQREILRFAQNDNVFSFF
jgi:hypothetical protein